MDTQPISLIIEPVLSKEQITDKAYYQKNKDLIKAKQRERYKGEHTKILAYNRAWRKANPEKARASVKKWQAEHPEYKQRSNSKKLLVSKIEELRKHIATRKRRGQDASMLEERLGCYERSLELNFLDKTVKFNPSNPRIPVCAINAGLKEAEELKLVIEIEQVGSGWFIATEGRNPVFKQSIDSAVYYAKGVLDDWKADKNRR